MRLKIKESLVYSVSDPTWLSKSLKWLLAYVGVVTAPILLGYHFEVIRRVARGEEECLPPFQGLGKMWKQGVFSYFGMILLMFPPALLNMGCFALVGLSMDNRHPNFWIFVPFFVIHMGLGLALGLLAPAMMLRYAMTEQVSSMWKIRALWSDIRQGTGDYLLLAVGFPFLMFLVMGVVSLTGVGAILAIPALPLIAFAHAHMLGSYYRNYFE